jgi:CTP:molybdopterin cytidylyltransferase MocA
MGDRKIGAIILAAGLSTRMGEFKPLLSIGPKTLLGHAISLFQQNDIDDIVVVTGHQSSDLKQELARYPCRPVLNAHFTDGMFSSLQVGVQALDITTDAFFLLPVDIPLVQQDTINKLLEAMDQDRQALVFFPEYQTRRGHPPLIRRELAAAILSFDEPGGLRALFRRYQQQTRNVSVDDPHILLDADTQSDLVTLKDQYLKASL